MKNKLGMVTNVYPPLAHEVEDRTKFKNLVSSSVTKQVHGQPKMHELKIKDFKKGQLV